MSYPAPTTEQHVLNASGLLAILLVAWVSYIGRAPVAVMLLHLAFAVAFMVGANAASIQLQPRHGRWSILIMYLVSLILVAVAHNSFSLILAMVLMASAPYHLSNRACWLLFVVANLGYALALHQRSELAGGMISFGSYIALQAFALSSSLARKRELDTQQVLSRKNNELLAARALMANQSRTEERLRIAGDLHDTIGHQLTALRLQLEALYHESPVELLPRVERCKTQAAELLEEIRAIVRRMASEKGSDLIDAIAQLERLTPGLEIAVTSELPRLVPELSQQLVFCIQEGIHNALRHGGATRIELSASDEGLIMRDNGSGLRGTRGNPGFGLRSIAQRLQPFGASAELTARPDGRGCDLRFLLPAGTPS